MREQKRRFFDVDPGLPTPTVIGADSVVVGDIRGTGQFVVYGEVHGDGEIAGSLNLAVTGVWNGYIRAERAIVAGKVSGGLTVQGKLQIGRTAVIRGKVSAGMIAIAKGAILDGDLEVTSEAPLQEFEEKRGE
jgi:cytoskeletal protein CcmA (bactofilin family)